MRQVHSKQQSLRLAWCEEEHLQPRWVPQSGPKRRNLRSAWCVQPRWVHQGSPRKGRIFIKARYKVCQGQTLQPRWVCRRSSRKGRTLFQAPRKVCRLGQSQVNAQPVLHLVSEEPDGGVGSDVNGAVLAVLGRSLVVFVNNEMLTVEKGSGSHQHHRHASRQTSAVQYL